MFTNKTDVMMFCLKWFFIVYILTIFFGVAYVFADNEITLDIHGDNFTGSFTQEGGDNNEINIDQISDNDDTTMTISQDGDNNEVKFSMNHDDNEVEIIQTGDNNTVSWVSYWGSGLSWGGDLDGTNNDLKFEQTNTTGSDSNRIGFHIPGNNNIVHACQGATFSSSTDTTCSGTTPNSEYGGHTINIDIHAHNNNVKIGQETGTNNADHYAQLYYYSGDSNNTFVTQRGNGNKTLNFTVRTDGGEQEIMQKGDGSHTATIDLTGSYKTDLDLIQKGNTTQSYSLTNTCNTIGGCTVTVEQDGG